jgi:hypothetical protein
MLNKTHASFLFLAIATSASNAYAQLPIPLQTLKTMLPFDPANGSKVNACSSRSFGCAVFIGNGSWQASSPQTQAWVIQSQDFFIGGRELEKPYTLTFFQEYSLKTSVNFPEGSNQGSVGLALRCIDPNSPAGTVGGLIQQPNLEFANGTTFKGTGVEAAATITGVWNIDASICPQNTFRIEVNMKGDRVTFGPLSYTNTFE